MECSCECIHLHACDLVWTYFSNQSIIIQFHNTILPMWIGPCGKVVWYPWPTLPAHEHAQSFSAQVLLSLRPPLPQQMFCLVSVFKACCYVWCYKCHRASHLAILCVCRCVCRCGYVCVHVCLWCVCVCSCACVCVFVVCAMVFVCVCGVWFGVWFVCKFASGVMSLAYTSCSQKH